MNQNHLATIIRETAIELSHVCDYDVNYIVIKLINVDIFSSIKDNPSWQEIGILFNVSKGRARQIEHMARKKVQKYSKQTGLLIEHINSIDNKLSYNNISEEELNELYRRGNV